jgi:hypothetical protein
VVGQPVVKGLAPREWRAAWLDPRTGTRHDLGAIEPALDLSYRPPPPPSGEDWVLLVNGDDGG